MRLIDADKLKRRVQSVATEAWKLKLEAKVETTLNQFLDYVEQSPTIDAVSVVRCRECRYWEMRNSPRGWCVVHQGYVSPQYFCADGERKESE